MSRGYGEVQRFALAELRRETERIGGTDAMSIALASRRRECGGCDECEMCDGWPARAELESVRRALRGLRRDGLAVRTDLDFWGESDREIASRVGVDHKTVGKMRREMEQRGEREPRWPPYHWIATGEYFQRYVERVSSSSPARPA